MTSPERFPFPPGARGRPPQEFARRLAHDPLGEITLPSGDEAVLAVRHADVAAVYSDPRFSRDLRYPGAPRMTPGFDLSDLPDALINMDPPEHGRLRRLLAGAFTPRRVEAWRPRVRAIAHRLIDGFAGETVDFVQEFAFPLPVEVICDLMGVDDLDVARVRHWSDGLLSTAGLSVEEQATIWMEFTEYGRRLVARHRRSPGDGLIDTLIQARDEEDRLSEEELVNITVGLILAGHETTGSTLARGVLRLLDEREHYEELVADPALVRPAVEELLRLEPPGDAGLLRVATEDVALPSGVIRKGQAVLPSGTAASRDPAVFPDPDAYRLDRGQDSHLTFGRGPHYCLGANLARMELQEALGAIVTRLPKLALAVPADQIEWTYGNMIRRPVRLPLTLG